MQYGFASGARTCLAAGPKGCGFTVAFVGKFHLLSVHLCGQRQVGDAKGHCLLARVGTVDSGLCSCELMFNRKELKTIDTIIATYKYFNGGVKFCTLLS